MSPAKFLLGLLQRVAPEITLGIYQLHATLEMPPTVYARILLRAVGSEALSKDEKVDLAALALDSLPEIPEAANSRGTATYWRLISMVDSDPAEACAFARFEALNAVGSSKPAHPEEVLELAAVLGAWSIASLRLGRPTFAAHLAANALFLHGPANFSETYPPILRISSAIFAELGERQCALAAAQHCHHISQIVEDRAGQTKSAIALAAKYTLYGMPDRALRILYAQREVPPELQFRIRHSAAYVLLGKGRVRESLVELQSAEPNSQYETIHKMHLLAKILEAKGELRKALEAYDQLIEASAGFLEPSHRLVIFLELVPLLRSVDEASVTRVLAAKFLGDLERLERGEVASRLRNDVLNAATRGCLSPDLERYTKHLDQDY